jgi:hypothetical protein
MPSVQLEIIHTVFGDTLSVENDFEYAVGVLLDYAAEGGIDGDVEDALSEIADTFGYRLVSK